MSDTEFTDKEFKIKELDNLGIKFKHIRFSMITLQWHNIKARKKNNENQIKKLKQFTNHC